VRSGRHQVQRTDGNSRDIRADSWAAVADPATGAATLLVPGGRQARAYVEDFGNDGQHLGMWMPMTLRAGETREAVGWLVLCRTTEMEAYAATRDAWPGTSPARLERRG
jgi:hypothetical protein